MDWGGCREQPPLFEQYPHKNGKSFLHFVFDRRKKICIIEENPLPPVRAGSIYFGVLRSW